MAVLPLLVALLVTAPVQAPSTWPLQGDKHLMITPRKLFKRAATQDIDYLHSSIVSTFADSVENAVRYLSSTEMEVLVHLSQKDQDVLLLLINGTISEKCPIQAGIYTNFMVLSHLPVTVMATLLPDLLNNGYTLPDNFTGSKAHESLEKFQKTLNQFSTIEFTRNFTNAQRCTALNIVNAVSAFVTSTLLEPSTLNKGTIQGFVRGIKLELARAAKFAVEDYFKVLNCSLNCVVGNSCNASWSNSRWSIAIVVDGFSYPGSFLGKYYTQLIESQFGSNETYSPRRLVFMPHHCNASIDIHCMDSPLPTMAISDAALASSISQLFDLSGPYPLHSLLSEAANEIFAQPSLTLRGFTSFEEKLYVILIVALFSTATVFLVVVISVCSEDKVIRMDDKQTKIKIDAHKKGPSLLTPISEKKFTSSSSYSSFNQLKKRHTMQDPNSGQAALTPLLDKEATQHGNKQHSPSSEPGSPVANTSTVTHTEITLADLAES